MNNQWFSKVAVWLVIALVLFTVFKQFDRGATTTGQIGYSDFLEEVRSKRISSVQLQEGAGGSTEIRARTNDGKELRTTATYLDRGLVGDLINNGVKFDVKPREEPSFLLSLLASWGPILLLNAHNFSMSFSVFSRQSFTRPRSVGYLMSAGATVASRIRTPLFPPPPSGGSSLSSGLLSSLGCARSYMSSLTRCSSSGVKRFRKCTIIEASNSGSLRNAFRPTRYCA